MAELALLLELIDDVVISATTATTGGHASLAHIPGAALRGAAARRLYGASGIDSFELFHSGAVRFGDGWPVDPTDRGGRLALPMPLALHCDKRDIERHARRQQLDPTLVDNRSCPWARQSDQPKSVPGRFVTHELGVLAATTRFRMKTAITAATGRAAPAQLFGYEAIVAGSQFLAVIEAEDPALLARVGSELRSRPIRLGRSKGTEYGRVRVIQLDHTRLDWPAEPPVGDDGQVVFWALSDLALTTADGTPTLTPTPAMFGLDPAYQLAPARSFVRSRRYLPFNAHWGSPELERVVIVAGSVLTFSAGTDSTPPAAPRRWVGAMNELGLGRVWAQPPLLARPEPCSWWWPPVPLPSAPPEPLADHPLLGWLGRHTPRKEDDALEEMVRKRVDELMALYDQAASLAGRERDRQLGPGVSQWQQVAAAARQSRDLEALKTRLFDQRSGIARVRDQRDAAHDLAGQHGSAGDQRWGARCRIGEAPTFCDWLQGQVDALPEADVDRGLKGLHLLANDAAERLKGRRP